MGEPEQADPTLIPDFSCMDPAECFVGKRYIHARANYMLESDNIMDLLHIEFLHAGTLGSDAVRSSVGRVEQTAHTVWSYRQTTNEVMSDFLYDSMGLPRGLPVDRWFDVRWDAPACMLLYAGATPTGQPRSAGPPQLLFPHFFTPETERTTHYWFSATMPRAIGENGAQIVEHIAGDLNKHPFTDEDLPMLEAQQRAMGDADFWSLRPVLLAGDAGAVRARRVLDRLIADELAARN